MNDNQMMTFGGHLKVLRQMVLRILGATFVLAVVIFCLKETVFSILFAPSNSDFITYHAIERLCSMVGLPFHFEQYEVAFINTELSSQFMTHLTTSLYLALLGVSPYIVVELFRFITPALYDDAQMMSHYRRHALVQIALVAAIITPPDLLTLILVTLPMYGLYELSICIAAHMGRNRNLQNEEE